MDAQTEAAFERKAERHFKSQRTLLPGRDYRFNILRWITYDERQSYRKNFDTIFPKSPGARI
jgi:hypothetical protein